MNLNLIGLLVVSEQHIDKEIPWLVIRIFIPRVV